MKKMLMIRVGTIVFAILAINAAISGYFFKDEITKRTQAQARDISKDIIRNAGNAFVGQKISRNYSRAFNRSLAVLVNDYEYLISAGVIDRKGAYIFHSRPELVNQSAPHQVMEFISGGKLAPVRTNNGYTHILPIEDSEGIPLAYLLLDFDPHELTQPMRKLVLWLIVMVAVSLAVTYVMIDFLVAGKLSKPLASLAAQTEILSSGDLTRKAPMEGFPEIRALAKAFNNMAENLRKITSKIRDVADRTTETCRKLFSLSGDINHGSRQQMTSLQGAGETVNRMEANVEEIAAQTTELNNLSQNTSASIMEMVASISEVDSNVENLVSMVDDIASSILQISQSSREVAGSVESLSREAESSASSLSQMNISLSQVDKGTSNSADLSAQVAETAETGINSIQNTQEGMQVIRKAAESASESINRLGELSGRIGKILGVINKIAEETNLLALNAAIIAAEAGEHGRGFNVVANEIQTLAERTTLQTKEIDTLIKDVQNETRGSVSKVEEVLKSVESGEKLTSETAKILESIVSVANNAKSLIQQIAKATDEQTKVVKRVAEGSEKVSNEVNRILKATSEQAKGSSRIIESIEKIRDVVRSVQTAIREQNEGSRNISASSEQMKNLISHVNEQTEIHRQDAQLVSDIVRRNIQIVEENVNRVEEMENSVETLLTLASGLNDEIRRFKIDEEEPDGPEGIKQDSDG